MKKRTVLIMVALLLIPIAALSFSPEDDNQMRVSTGNTTDATIQTVSGYFYGIIVHTDGTKAPTFNLYDFDGVVADASRSTKILADWVVTTSSTDRTQSISYYPPVAYSSGIDVDIADAFDISPAGSLTYDIYYHER